MKSSREQFEDWFKSEHEEVENSQELSAKVMKMISWSSWQASRAAIEIELPWLGQSSLMETDDVVEAIELQGLTAKAKP